MITTPPAYTDVNVNNQNEWRLFRHDADLTLVKF